jgi:hypothetical protein
MKKILAFLLLISIFSVKASEQVQAKPVLIKNTVDGVVNAGKWLAASKAGKFLADNKVTNTVTQDEYVQKTWADKLGKPTLIASLLYFKALYHFLRSIKTSRETERSQHEALCFRYTVYGALLNAFSYAYINK